jgi:hypothetical protein
MVDKKTYNEENLVKLQKVAFDYAFYLSGNLEASKDISSQAISLFLLSNKPAENERRWIINTTKNYCNKYFDKISRDRKNQNKYGFELIAKFSETSEVESDVDFAKAFKVSFETLLEEELQTILYYFKCNESIKEMSENLEDSYAAVRKRISRIKKKLKAETYKNLGYYGSKIIVTPQLNNLIVKFIKRFKENLENNTLTKMHYYFSKIDIANYKQNIHIKEIFDYEIELNNSIYKTWVIYINHQEEYESFIIEFFIDDKNYLKILTPPTQTKKVITFTKDSSYGKQLTKLIKSYPIDKDGQPKIPKDEIERIVQQFKEKQNKS